MKIIKKIGILYKSFDQQQIFEIAYYIQGKSIIMINNEDTLKMR